MKKKNLNEVFKNSVGLKSFLICFVILIYFQFKINQTEFYNDANWYFTLSKMFYGDNNSFSLLNFPRTVRGYFFPFLLSPIRGFYLIAKGTINEFYLYRIYLSFLHSLTFAVLIPATFEKIFNKKVSVLKRIIFLLVMLYFWQGFFIHPYTELLMIFTLIMALYCFLLMIDKDKISLVALYGLGVGIFMYGAYNTRTINIVFIFILPVILLLYGKNRSFKLNIIGMTAILIGTFAASIPQAIINKNISQNFSPLVLAEDIPYGLFVNQLYRGINTIRYQAYLGEESYPDNLIFYHDAGSAIFNAVRGEISFKTYLVLLSEYPLDFIGIYFNHLFAALDLRWNSDYVYDVNNANNLFALLNYSFWFIAIVFSKEVFNFSKNVFSKSYLFFWFFLPGSLASLPAPTESRYYISMYVCLYIYLIFNSNFAEILDKIKKHPIKYFATYIVFLLIMYSLSGIILGSLNSAPIFLSGPSDFSLYFEHILTKYIKLK